MTFPPFFDQVRRIRMRDPLSDLLGSAEDGVLEYGYADAVRLAGHSCPTVAGTYLMLAKGLEALFGDDLPERGAIRVAFPHPRTEGVTGVMAAVATLVTGATGDDGFKGLGGLFDRRGLLSFGGQTEGDITLAREDSGKAVAVHYSTQAIPADPEMGTLLGLALSGQATESERSRFGDLWQDRVRRILLDHADDPDVVRLRALD